MTAHRHLMKVSVSLDLPYDRYLPQSCVTFHYKRRRRCFGGSDGLPVYGTEAQGYLPELRG
jgi:hypothetical protein